ncbi:MAG: response regulator [Acidobacteria bacterium]|nr:response regulator [Acidobacteriota bacterium]
MKRVMTVDDSRSMRQMVRMTLEQEGFEVVEAGDGQDALSKLDGREFHLFLADINMPNMDGIELVRRLRVIPEQKFVPIVLLTTESQPEKKQEGKAAGATAWIVKPFQPAGLMSVIRKLVR